MVPDPWLPVGFRLPDDGCCRSAQWGGGDWQLYETDGGGRLLVAREELARRWAAAGLVTTEALPELAFGQDRFRYLRSTSQHALVPVDQAVGPSTKSEAAAFALALRRTRIAMQEASLHDAIYVERLSVLLPVWSLSSAVADDVVFGTWLTSGVQVSAHSFRRLASFMSWLPQEQLRGVVDSAGLKRPEQRPASASSQTATQDLRGHSQERGASKVEFAEPFKLAGRAQLEGFFNEHVIEIVQNAERYRALGIDFPSAIVLHGPPGCGKTFAIERLVEFLGWPSFSIDSSTIGSPYIHETGKKIAKAFDDALKASPSAVVIDEMESFLSDRQAGGGQGLSHVEEVAEFLRRIPEAIKNHVLVLGMTNRIEMIDPAILRRGRFDHVIEVGMPSAEEVRSLLASLLAALPLDASVVPEKLTEALTGRPLSDVSFTVREGARLAARAGRSTIDQTSLLAALTALPARAGAVEAQRRIGFREP